MDRIAFQEVTLRIPYNPDETDAPEWQDIVDFAENPAEVL